MASLNMFVSLSTPPLLSLSTPAAAPRNYHFLCFQTKPRSRTLCSVSVDQQTPQSSSGQPQSPPNTSPPRIVFAAGGFGGNIYPAVAIADEIRNTYPDAEILFIGLLDGMESTAVPSAGYDFEPIRSTTRLARPVVSLKNITLPVKLIRGMSESWQILKEFSPHVVVGTGGYVSFPTSLVAAVRGLKLVIQEQNSVPGIANWLLSLLADTVFVAYNSSVDTFPADKKKIIVSGNPVRLSLRKSQSKTTARGYYFPDLVNSPDVDANAKVVLVLGGSLGANPMNIALLNIYNQMLMERENLYIVWETGVESFDEMESLVRDHPRLVLAPFLHSMDLAYAAADLVVSRAGAMTCSELLVTGKPAILIPSPNVDEGHQFRNASLMADLAGSRIITEDELDSITLKFAMEEILDNEILTTAMSERALRAAKPNAATEIAEHIVSLINASRAVENLNA